MPPTSPQRLVGCLALALSAAACGPDCSGTPAEQVAAVRATFDGYRQALSEVDGAAAVRLVDAGTLAYYGAMREAALHAPADEVRALGVADRIFVLTMRHRMTADELESLDAAGLFAHGVERQWIGAESVEVNSLGEIRVEDDDATAHGQMLAYGEPTPLSWTFRCEDGRWRLDLVAALRLADAQLEEMVRQGGQDPDEVLLSILETVSGERPDDAVWEPLAGR